MVYSIALKMILGIPLVVYGGIFTLFMLIFTAAVGYLNFHGYSVIPFKWHPKLAIITLVSALLHGLMGLSIYLNF